MKANRKKGAARPGAQVKNHNIKLKKAKENVFDRMDKGITCGVTPSLIKRLLPKV